MRRPILIKVLIPMLVTNYKKRSRMTNMSLVTFYILFGTLSATINGSCCFSLSISIDLRSKVQ